ncbi:iron-containing alcohol dehydrogenase, partial [Aquisalimonas sp.]|uniref:iron-containing alcohol dehydrogenase n=1 Tax=Aquisalimonas sp. TaxID=1872621 RepID=UPI0025BCA04A
MSANIVLPRHIRLGAGASRELGAVLQQLEVRHPFIVTDQDMVKFGYLDTITKGLDEAGIPYVVFPDTVPDPTVASVNKGVEALKKSDHDG